MLRRSTALSLGLLLVVPAVALAVGASNQGVATVLTPLSANGVRDLDFQNVFPGVAKLVARTDATSAKWTILGQTSAEVTLDFTLPLSLVSGANSLPISFGATDAGSNTVDNAGTAGSFDPSVQATRNLDGTTGELYVWLGGQVTPAANQPAGLYSASITVDVNYTGN